jgi:hypothetical protein
MDRLDEYSQFIHDVIKSAIAKLYQDQCLILVV